LQQDRDSNNLDLEGSWFCFPGVEDREAGADGGAGVCAEVLEPDKVKSIDPFLP